MNVYYLYGPQTHYVSLLVSIQRVSLLFLPPAEYWAGAPALGSHTHYCERDGDISGPDTLGAELLRKMAIGRKKAEK